MAITKTVTLISVNEAGESFNQKLLTGTVNLLIKRDTIELINQNFSADYEAKDGTTIDQRLAIWSQKMLVQMQNLVDKYVREQTIKTNAKVATAVTALQTNLNIGGII